MQPREMKEIKPLYVPPSIKRRWCLRKKKKIKNNKGFYFDEILHRNDIAFHSQRDITWATCISVRNACARYTQKAESVVSSHYHVTHNANVVREMLPSLHWMEKIKGPFTLVCSASHYPLFLGKIVHDPRFRIVRLLKKCL